MYDIIYNIIGHTWQSNYSGDQQYIYYISGAMIVLFSIILIDMIYRILWSICHRGNL